MPLERYKLETTLRIVKEVYNGPMKDGKPQSENEGGYWSHSGPYDSLSVNETTNLGSLDFLGVMGVLGKLHEAIQTIVTR